MLIITSFGGTQNLIFSYQAAETVSTEDRPNVAAEYMGKAARLYVRTKNYDKAVSALHTSYL